MFHQEASVETIKSTLTTTLYLWLERSLCYGLVQVSWIQIPTAAEFFNVYLKEVEIILIMELVHEQMLIILHFTFLIVISIFIPNFNNHSSLI